MVFTWQCNGTCISISNYFFAGKGMCFLRRITKCSLTSAMDFFLASLDISIHMDNQKIKYRCQGMHIGLQFSLIVFTPFPDTFPAISKLSYHVRFRLNHLIIVFFIGNRINDCSNQFKIPWTFCNNSYCFHYRFGTPPSRPSVHNLDRE